LYKMLAPAKNFKRPYLTAVMSRAYTTLLPHAHKGVQKPQKDATVIQKRSISMNFNIPTQRETRYSNFENKWIFGGHGLHSDSHMVLTETCQNGLAIVTLNRPEALNAGRLDMITALTAVLRRCAESDQIAAVVIQGAGDRAFSAGGDMKSVYPVVKDDMHHHACSEAYKAFRSPLVTDQFFQEYHGVHALATCPKPTIALLDGVTMGWGLGLGCSAQYRLVTENSVFAMPENRMGLFPDALFSYLASKMPAGVGRLMATTGVHVKNPSDALFAGLGTHFVPSPLLDKVTDELRNLKLHSQPAQSVEKAIRDCIQGLAKPAPEPKGFLQGPWVEKFAKFEGAADAFKQLEAAKAKDKEASELFEAMQTGSPLSQCVSWHMIEEALKERLACNPHDEKFLIKKALERDFAAAHRMLWREDFVEGVRATLIDKDGNASWKPKTHAEVPMELIPQISKPLSIGRRQLGLPEVTNALQLNQIASQMPLNLPDAHKYKLPFRPDGFLIAA
jgi:3-hydroxyisobutyryl-CoA hydrolase